MSDGTVIPFPEELVDRIAERAAEIMRRETLGKDPCRDANSEGWGSSPYLTVAEAADYLRAKPQRVYDLLSARRLTRHHDGRRVLVSRAEVEEHLRR